jgi:ribosomal protein S27AE
MPTFQCAFCRAELQTVAYVGETARKADEMRAFFQRVVETPNDVGAAPRLPAANRGATRPSRCRKCGGAIEVSLDLHVKQVTCGACGQVDFVNAHISDGERLKLDMAQQMAGNAAFRELRASGVKCGKCGSANPVPDDGSVQVICHQCGQPILLADHVDADAVARARLRHAALEMRDGIRAQQNAKEKTERRIVGIVLGVVFGIVAIVVAIAVLTGKVH